MPAPLPLMRRRSAALLLAASLATLTACGSDDGEGNADEATAPTASAAPSSPTDAGDAGTDAAEPSEPDDAEGTQSLTVTAVDFAFELESTDLAAGEYEIEVVNGGGASHDLSVERDGEDVAATETIAPGESATLSVPLEPGEYVFYCSVGNHRASGMEVTVTVT